MPIQGTTRFRKHQVGSQASFGSNVTATRILPFRGPIVVEPAREDPDVDVGSLDPILSPFNGPKEVTGTWEGKLPFDEAPYLWNGAIKGGVTPTGGATGRIWTFQAASTSSDTFGYITDEWGDDYSTDVMVARDGVIDQLEIGFDEDLSAFDINADLVYANANLCDDFTAGLTIDASPQWVYGADTEIFIDTVYTSIGTTKLTDAVHGATLTINNNLDRKRFANGSNTRFALAGYGRGPREIELQLVLAKTTATVAEACTLDDEPVPDRFIEIRTTSPELVTGGSTPYSQSIRLPMRLMSREDGEINNNTVITLTYKGFYHATLGYAIRVVVVNGLSAL
jgi:hypothetical protein